MNDIAPSVDRLELFQTFVRIVEAGSLSAAAQQLGTTQPTISRRLQQLERFLGMRLLQRTTHTMKLTADGERCLAHARLMLESWAAMESDLRGVQDRPRGLLRVQVPHAFGQAQLVAPLVLFLRDHPEVSVDWLLHDRELDLVARGIDCAIRVGKLEDPSVVAIRLAVVPRIVVGAPGVWGKGPLPSTPQALQTLPWLAIRSFYLNEVQLFSTADEEACTFPIKPRFSTDNLFALRNAALAGAGIGIVSSWLVAQDLAEGRLVHLAPNWAAAPLPVYLVYPKAAFYPARLTAFVTCMQAHLPYMEGIRET